MEVKIGVQQAAREVVLESAQSADDVVARLFSAQLNPNLPKGKVTVSDSAAPAPA